MLYMCITQAKKNILSKINLKLSTYVYIYIYGCLKSYY